MEHAVQFAGVALPTSDPVALGRWYVDHLGVAATPPGLADPQTLRVLPTARLRPGDDARISLVAVVRDLDAIVLQLRTAGVAVDADPTSALFERRAQLVDPEGNRVELRQEPGASSAEPYLVRAIGEPDERPQTAHHRAAWALGVLLLLIAVVVAVLLAGTSQRSDAGAELDQVRAVDATVRHALVEADVRVLRRDLAADFHLVAPTGEPVSRSEYLRAVENGDLDFRVFDPASELSGRLSGNLAVLTYSADIDAVSGETHVVHTVWVTHVYERRDDRWLLVNGQTTDVGSFPPSGAG